MKYPDIIRKVAFDIDEFEMKHYNEDTKGVWERVYGDLDQIDEQIHELQTRKESCLDLSEMAWDLTTIMANTRCEVDQLEHLGVQNGLIRSKHLHNFLLAARHRDTQNTENYYASDIDYVNVRIPWYLVNNLIEKLYLKYHETRIHRVFDLINKYIFDEKEEHEDWKGIYVWWGEIKEIWHDEIDDEETISNHYHDHDTYWEYDIDPKECKNKKDFFRKRVKAKIKEKKEEERLLLEQAKEDEKNEEELKIIRAKEHKLKKYTSIEEFSNQQKGSVYLFADVKQKFAKSKKLSFGVLYVGESRNFNNRFTAYAHKDGDSYSELEKRLINRFPEKSKSEIKEFVRDPEQCKLKVITNKKLSNHYYRKKCERKFIIISQPLLNLKGTQ